MNHVLTIAGGLALAVVASQASAASPDFCMKYANQAVAQQQGNLQKQCGYGAPGYVGPGWSADHGLHFTWCLTVPEQVAKQETFTRASQLKQCAAQQGGGGVQLQTEYLYKEPKIGGARLDWCRVWAGECGKPAADAFCKAKGHGVAISFNIAEDIGAFEPTKIISSGQVCADGSCDGFALIKCGE